MKLRTAFVLSLLAVMAVMAVPAVHGVQRVGDVRRIALDLREQVAQAALEVGRLQAGLARLDRYHRSYVATADPELGTLAAAAADSLGNHIERIRAAGYAAAIEDIDFPHHRLRSVVAGTAALVEDGRLEEATVGLEALFQPPMASAEAAARALAAAIDAATTAKIADADRLSAEALRASVVALLLAALIAAALTFTAARVLTRPIDRLSTAMARVADGAFEPPDDLPYDRADELGTLFRAFRSMALRLADLDRMKAELVGIASHDLKTPVNVIAGYAEMIDDEAAATLQPRQRRLVRTLREQAETLGRRLDHLLEISRMEASGLRLGLEEINIRHFASGLHKAYAPSTGRNGVHFRVVVEDTAPSFIIADPDCLLADIFGNLLENSLRFTPRGGRIDLRIAGDHGDLSAEIRDSGAAIPPEDFAFVFDRYYHGRGRTGRIGNGPGLPIARAAALAHGGDLVVAAPSDGGVSFRLSLPIHPAPVAALT